MEPIVRYSEQRKKGVVTRLCIDDVIIEIRVITPDRYLRNGQKGRIPQHAEALFRCLPEVFTNNDLDMQIKRLGLLSPLRQFIYDWKRERVIEKVESKKYRKID